MKIFQLLGVLSFLILLCLAPTNAFAQDAAKDPCAAYTSQRGKMMCEQHYSKVGRMKAAKDNRKSYVDARRKRLYDIPKAPEPDPDPAVTVAASQSGDTITEGDVTDTKGNVNAALDGIDSNEDTKGTEPTTVDDGGDPTETAPILVPYQNAIKPPAALLMQRLPDTP